MRVRVDFSYDGSCFYGLQLQKSKKTVVGEFNATLKKIGITNPNIIPSSRTDRGVHAINQTLSIDLPLFWQDINKLKLYLQKHLDSGIYVKNITKVEDTFHPRYQAKSRVYRYIVSQKKLLPFYDKYISFIPNVDFVKVEKNIKNYEGIHDFLYFKKSGSSVKTTTREIKKAFVYKRDDLIIFHFEANGFLRSQVRMMVDALIKLDEKELKAQIEKKAVHSKTLAPPSGLYLVRVKY